MTRVAAIAAWCAVACAHAPAPVAPAPRVALEYDFSDSRPYEDDVEPPDEREDNVAIDVIARGDARTHIRGVVGDFVYYVRDDTLFRKPLSGGAETGLAERVPADVAIDVDGDEVFYTTSDCDVWSTRQYRLGGECRAAPMYLLHDATSLYLFAYEPGPWRRPEMTLWQMPRRRGVAQKIATLPDFDRVWGSDRPVFDGASFYYMDLYGTVFRIAKAGGERQRFLSLPTSQARELDSADATNVYVSSGGHLLRAPTNGGRPVAFATVGNGRIARDAQHTFLVTPDAFYAAAAAGGRWKKVTALPDGGWHVQASGGKAYLWNHDAVLRVDPAGRRAQQVLELDDLPITSLTWTSRGLLYTTPPTSDEAGDDLVLLSKDWRSPVRLCGLPDVATAPAFDDAFTYYVTESGALVQRLLEGGVGQDLVGADALPAALGVPVPTAAERKATRTRVRGEYPSLPRFVAVDATHAYFVDPALLAVSRVRKSGGPVEVLARLPGRPREFALDEGYVYVHHEHGNAVELTRLSKSGPATPTVLGSSVDDELRFGLTERGVVWSDRDHLSGWFRDRGFAALGQLSLRAEREGEGWAPDAWATSWNDVFFSQKEDSTASTGDAPHFIARRSLAGDYSILASHFTLPTLFAPAADTLYFVEGGFAAGPKSTMKRVECCSIWAIAR